MLSKLTYVALCRSIQLLVLLARGDATPRSQADAVAVEPPFSNSRVSLG